mgnify:CR=1 FL=1
MRKLAINELNRMEPEEFRQVSKHPVAVVLDNVRSMNNVGSAFRTCDAFLAGKIYLCGITASPPHRDIHKTALGATETVEWQHYKETATALQQLKQQGYKILAVEQTNQSAPLQSFNFNRQERYALVFGHEVFGVSDEALSMCDAAVEIPQFGTKHSLNIAVSIGIALWSCVQQFITEEDQSRHKA